MDAFEFIATLGQLKKLAEMIRKIDLKGFVSDARRTQPHVAKHGLRPVDLDLIIELAVQLDKTNETLARISERSEHVRKMASNARQN